MPISSLGAAHVAAALAALVLGALVLLMRKGTPLHRVIGMAYTVAMVVLCIAALLIYRSNGHFGPFHALALLSLATLARGIAAIMARPPRLSRHYKSMTFSYLGLLSAGVTQLLLYLPALQTPVRGMVAAVVSTAVFIAVGIFALPRLERRALTGAALEEGAWGHVREWRRAGSPSIAPQLPSAAPSVSAVPFRRNRGYHSAESNSNALSRPGSEVRWARVPG